MRRHQIIHLRRARHIHPERRRQRQERALFLQMHVDPAWRRAVGEQVPARLSVQKGHAIGLPPMMHDLGPHLGRIPLGLGQLPGRELHPRLHRRHPLRHVLNAHVRQVRHRRTVHRVQLRQRDRHVPIGDLGDLAHPQLEVVILGAVQPEHLGNLLSSLHAATSLRSKRDMKPGRFIWAPAPLRGRIRSLLASKNHCDIGMSS